MVIHFASKLSAPQGWGVSENLHNQIFLISTHFHFSLYFHHILFHPFCPLLSLSLSLPVSLAAAVANWVLCPFLLLFCFLTNIVFLSYIFMKKVIYTNIIIGADFTWTAIVPCPILFWLDLHQCYFIMKPNSWERVPPSLCLYNCM